VSDTLLPRGEFKAEGCFVEVRSLSLQGQVNLGCSWIEGGLVHHKPPGAWRFSGSTYHMVVALFMLEQCN